VVFVIYQLKRGRLPFSGYLIVNSGGKPPLVTFSDRQSLQMETLSYFNT
jgi:hypothetical protein